MALYVGGNVVIDDDRSLNIKEMSNARWGGFRRMEGGPGLGRRKCGGGQTLGGDAGHRHPPRRGDEPRGDSPWGL